MCEPKSTSPFDRKPFAVKITKPHTQSPQPRIERTQ